MSYIFEPPAIPSVAIAGSDARFPVRRIFCVGRNYKAHALEMGLQPTRGEPMFFTKPADAVVESGSTIPYPPETENFHYEGELVVAIGADGFRVPEEQVPEMIFGYGIGIDLTRRDLQAKARDAGRPWDWAKGFDNSAPCSALTPIKKTGELTSGEIRLSVNGEVRQDADISQMIWTVREIVSLISNSMHLKKGDLIYTGTPAGVGAVGPGDRLVASIEGLPELTLTIGEPE